MSRCDWCSLSEEDKQFLLYESELQPYLDKIGNCELVLLPGIHCIYDRRPDDVADIIRDFLERTEG